VGSTDWHALKSLHNQRDELLAFAGILAQKLAEIARCFKMPLPKVSASPSKTTHIQCLPERWNQLHHELSGKLHLLIEAVMMLNQTPRASSLVENLNSTAELLFLRKQLGLTI